MNRLSLAVLACILVGTSFLYYKSLTPSFSSDDYIHLEKNIKFIRFQDVSQVFLHLDGREYRPLVRLSLWLNYQMGTTALPFHITNLMLHLACIVCLYFLFQRLLVSRIGSLVGVTLFALHPIHTTNVDFIMGRTGMLCALFYFLSLYLFLVNTQKPSVWSYLISLGLFFISLLAKEEAISMPLLLFVLLLQTEKNTAKNLWRNFRRLSPFFMMVVVYLALHVYSLSGQYEQIAGYTNYNVLHIISNYINWILGFAYPFNLYKARWAFETGQFFQVAFPVAIIGLMAAALAYILWPGRRILFYNKMFLLGLLWFILTLTPIMGGNAHRWYLYIPSAGLCLSVVAACQQNYQGCRRSICMALFILAAVCFSVEVRNQSDIWYRQSQISERFLNQAEQLGLHRMDAFQFINLPFGYKSAFLFPFNSFNKALGIRTGKWPRIEILSRINLDDNTWINLDRGEKGVFIQMQPSAESYFIFKDLLRKFPNEGTALTMDGCRIRIKRLSKGQSTSAFEVVFLRKPEIPVFYFDGIDIHELPRALIQARMNKKELVRFLGSYRSISVSRIKNPF